VPLLGEPLFREPWVFELAAFLRFAGLGRVARVELLPDDLVRAVEIGRAHV